MSFNIPEKVFEDAYNGKMELIRNVKVRGIEYDYRKMEINYVTVLYDDNSSIMILTLSFSLLLTYLVTGV